MKIYSFHAQGTVIPYTLRDIHAALVDMGHEVYVGAPTKSKITAIDAIVATRPDLVLTVDRVGLFPACLAVMAEPARVVSWFFDNPMPYLTAADADFRWINDKYYVFSWDRDYLPQLAEAGYSRTDYLPFATNPAVYTRPATTAYEYDVSFVGTSNDHRRALIRHLADNGVQVDVFGDDGWQQLAHANVRFHGTADNRTECPAIYAASRINLNITNEQLLTSLPVRIFDVLATGGFILTDYRRDAEDLFDADAELKIYRDADDLLRQVRHFLAHADEREAVAAAGCARVHRDYTFRRQLDKLFARLEHMDQTPAEPRGVPAPQMYQALWITGTAYLKFGRLQEAHERLFAAMQMNPNDRRLLLAVAMLAARAGQTDAVETALTRLAAAGVDDPALHDHLRACARDQRLPTCWAAAYHGIDLGPLQPDGTVPGWQPQRLT